MTTAARRYPEGMRHRSAPAASSRATLPLARAACHDPPAPGAGPR
ncbi:hypothetical protein [Azoarcus olearius]|uniref:Uncharacterized protein n=1 Tax=Azoarcus sp. (strain BH72) TaxID=418699 RepID=A1K9Z4_AZOSB|nr:hypothetical protein [Azoarcus olearius]CAL95649.1 hypothetical protein predicted by Glimmer/Critica [Azoarcus olearius]